MRTSFENAVAISPAHHGLESLGGEEHHQILNLAADNVQQGVGILQVVRVQEHVPPQLLLKPQFHQAGAGTAPKLVVAQESRVLDAGPDDAPYEQAKRQKNGAETDRQDNAEDDVQIGKNGVLICI